MNFSQLLDEQIQSDFWTATLPVLRYIFFGIIVLSAIVLIVAVLMQTNDSNESGDILSGSTQESYYSKNKGSTRDGKLKLITIILSAIIAVSSVLYFVTELFNKTGN